MAAGQKRGPDLVILAAGKGKRMRSPVPKPLIEVCGRPMVQWAVDTARRLTPRKIHVVVSPQERGRIAARLGRDGLLYPVQARPRGTGDAVAAALPGVARTGAMLVIVGDAPLLDAPLLRRLLARAKGGLALLAAEPENPSGYGRILRDPAGNVRAIVEERDATAAQRKVGTVYAGAMAGPCALFRDLVPRIRRSPRAGERYLTDLVGMAAGQGAKVGVVVAQDAARCMGTNTPEELSLAERRLGLELARRLEARGVRLRDAQSLRIRGDVRCGAGAEIDANVVLEGSVQIGGGAVIRPNCVLSNVRIGAGTVVEAFSHLEDCTIGRDCTIGPYARMRADARAHDRVRVGNFVEVKKSTLGAGAKASHLSYIGDAEVGAEANVGAGAITCNYDGKRKSRTVIGDRAFIGSGTELVAPLRIGAGAVVGAGSTLTEDVPPESLALARARQVTKRAKARRGRQGGASRKKA